MSVTMGDNGIGLVRLLKDSKKLILSSNSEDVSKGLKNLKKVIKSDPDNHWAYIYYGVGASKSVKYQHEAVAAFEVASQLKPDSVECWKGIRTCLEPKTRTESESLLLMQAYSNLLRLEFDPDKWTLLYNDIANASSKNLSVSLVASLLSSLIEDFNCQSNKHKTCCKDLSYLAFSEESLIDTNLEDVLKAFKSWANFLDFSDRPEFCKKVCSFMSKLHHFDALSSFLHHTLLLYGPKTYTKIQLVQNVIDIAFDCLDNVKKLVPLVRSSLKEVENVKGFDQIKLALCIIEFFEDDFAKTREHLDNLSCMGDVSSTLFFLKFLCKAKDYDAVLFLSIRFAKTFAALNSDKLKSEFLMCLLEGLSSCNDVMLLEHAIRLGLKFFSKFGENHNLIYYLGQSYIGLDDPKAIFYLNKLRVRHNEDAEYLNALLNLDTSGIPVDSDKWLSSALLSANLDLIHGNLKSAVKAFTKIGVKDNCLCEPFLVLGVDSLDKGNIDKAASCFHRAFSLRPLDADILKYYLDSLFKLNEDQLALQVLTSVSNSNSRKWHLIGEKALLASGLIYSAKYDHEKSIRCFKHLIKLMPDRLEFLEAITDEYIHLGRLGIAENYVSRLVSDDPYNLHLLLLLCEIHKLDGNYSAYYNQAVKCLNFSPEEVEEALRSTKLILSLFINFLNQDVKLEESSHHYISKMCGSALKKINFIAAKGNTKRSGENEYLIAVYKFVESHYLAVEKLMKLDGKSLECKKLITLCIKAIDQVMRIYGVDLICFWKLLGDILLLSSRLPFAIEIPWWLTEKSNFSVNNLCWEEVFPLERVDAALKCYAVGLNLVLKLNPSRLYEFYYDISVALISLANHTDINDPDFKYSSLKASLKSCLKSFVHSDGISNSRWIHSNLLGVIVSLLGVRENMFKEHFSSLELQMKEGLMLQNYATHLSKIGLYSQAEKTFEQARLTVDMDYSSSWIGQLLMQLINNDIETKKMVEYNLTQIGYHSLFKWILGYYFCKNKPGLNFHGGQYSLLNYTFSEERCTLEKNPSRLTLMAYIHELIGNTTLARRLYFRVLRLAKQTDETTYNYFLSNAIRLNRHCKLNYKLIELLDREFCPSAAVSLYNVCSNHILVLTPNRNIFFKALVVMKYLMNSLSSNEEGALVAVIPLIALLSDLNLNRYLDSKLPFVLEFLIKNITILFNMRRKELKQIISVIDCSSRSAFFKHINKFISLRKFMKSHNNNNGLITIDSVSNLTFKSDDKSGSIARLTATKDPSNRIDSLETQVVSTSLNRSMSSNSTEITSYSRILTNLRTIFPLPLTDQERLALKQKKILSFQLSNISQPEVKKFKKEAGTYLDVMEQHGCHSNCIVIFSLLQKSVASKSFQSATKFADICLNIKCSSCIQISKFLPLICFLTLETKDARLIQKAIHLYPSHSVLWKTAHLLLNQISG